LAAADPIAKIANFLSALQRPFSLRQRLESLMTFGKSAIAAIAAIFVRRHRHNDYPSTV
jgi:hypothetical protein